MPKIPALPPMTSPAPNDLVPIEDVSDGNTKYISLSALTGYPDFGWSAIVATHTFTSFDSATRIGVITVPSDATLTYTPGMRYRLTQATGGIKYAIIHAVSATSLSLLLASGTTLNNEAITAPMFSPLDTPLGFPRNRDAWEIRKNITGNTANAPTKGAWYRPQSADVITYGVGKWLISYSATPRTAGSASAWISGKTTLSTTTNSETIVGLTAFHGKDDSASGLITLGSNNTIVDHPRTVTSGTETLNLLHNADCQGTIHSSNGINAGGYLSAVSAYL